MGRLTDLGWAIRDRMTAAAVAIVLGLCGLGAGVAGVVIALDARDAADRASASDLGRVLPQGGASQATSVPAADPKLEAEVEELNDRVAAIEESVSELRTELGAQGAAPAP